MHNSYLRHECGTKLSKNVRSCPAIVGSNKRVPDFSFSSVARKALRVIGLLQLRVAMAEATMDVQSLVADDHAVDVLPGTASIDQHVLIISFKRRRITMTKDETTGILFDGCRRENGEVSTSIQNKQVNEFCFQYKSVEELSSMPSRDISGITDRSRNSRIGTVQWQLPGGPATTREPLQPCLVLWGLRYCQCHPRTFFNYIS